MPIAIRWIRDFLDGSSEKLVVFARHRAILKRLPREFHRIFVAVDGSVRGKKRQAAVDRFQNDPKIRLFLGNMKAAGHGLNLTAASSVLFLELGWTPAEHEQAEDRVLRIGQEAGSVNVYYLIGRGTVEERILEMLADKRDICGKVLDGVGFEGLLK
jgi:SWI/SNF-related matrix-associated actin-dependent regulator 1 of chromatin subfamily A